MTKSPHNVYKITLSKHMKRRILTLFLFAAFAGFTQEELAVKASIDTTQIRIGEQFEYSIQVAAKEDVVFPKLDSLGLLEVVSSEAIDTLREGLLKKYKLTGFDSGSFVIPKQRVLVLDKTYNTEALLVQVATVAVDTLKQKPFPIKPIFEEPFVFDDLAPYFVWAYLLIGIILLIVFVYLFLKKQQRATEAATEIKIPPFQETIEKFDSLDAKELWQKNQVKEFYVELTEIVRTYIGREVHVHTLEATTDELLALIQEANNTKSIGISKEAIQTLENFLKHADFVKFAKLRPEASEIQQDRTVAESFVKELQPTLQAYNEKITLAEEALEKERLAAIKKQPKKLSKRSLVYLSIIAFLILFVAIITYRIVQNSNGGSRDYGSTSEVVVNDDWTTQSFGSPALTLSAPVKIPLQTNEVPVQAKSVLSDLNVYSYEDKDEEFQIAITTLQYTAQIQPEIEQVLQTTLENVQAQQGVENFEYERQPANLESGLQGTYLTGQYTQEDRQRAFKLIGFSDGNKVWQVFTLSNFEDEETQILLENVVQSITIEKE